MKTNFLFFVIEELYNLSFASFSNYPISEMDQESSMERNRDINFVGARLMACNFFFFLTPKFFFGGLGEWPGPSLISL
jgi:hypothetical protein